jgi:hypothetical protein
MDTLVPNYPQARWAHEGGGQCLTTMWTWIHSMQSTETGE